MRTPRRKCHYRAVTLADDPRARLALRDIPAISLAALECDLLWCGLREFGEFSYVRPHLRLWRCLLGKQITAGWPREREPHQRGEAGDCIPQERTALGKVGTFGIFR
jgi:hypothetical protein